MLKISSTYISARVDTFDEGRWSPFKGPWAVANGLTGIRNALVKCLLVVSWTWIHLLTYSMVQSPSWEANWLAASQGIPRILWNPKVHYRTRKPPPPVPILGQPNPVHIPTSHLLEIHRNIIHPSKPRSPQWSLSLLFPLQDHIHPTLLTHTRHMPSPSHSFSILSLSQYWVRGTDHLTPRYAVSSKYSPQHHVLKHPQLPFLPLCQWPSFTPIQNNRQNYSSIYLNPAIAQYKLMCLWYLVNPHGGLTQLCGIWEDNKNGWL